MEEELLKQYMNEYYRGFTGFELEHLEDFAKCLKEYKEFNLAEYEVEHLDKDILFPPGDIKIGVRDSGTTSKSNVSKNILMDIAVFTMKMGGENIKRILEKIILENSRKDATTNNEQSKKVTTDNETVIITDEEIDRDKVKDFVTKHMILFYKSFMDFEKNYIDDFVIAIDNKVRVDLEDYEAKYLGKDFLLPWGKAPPGVRDKEKRMGDNIIKDNLMDAAAFTIKKGADFIAKILISLAYDLQEKDAAVENLKKTKDELLFLTAQQKEDKEKIDNLEKEKKIADERIRSLENEVIKLKELEKKMTTNEITKSSKPETIYKSTMEEENMEDGLKIKTQDELISTNGTYKKRFGVNKFKIPRISKDVFVDAPTDQISTIPRTAEEHEELDNLNNKFKGRLDEIETTTTMRPNKGKKKALENSDNETEEKNSKNKKRVVRKQGERENSDTE
ncbi:unnamed protein product [Rhizophagus irregularis]|nr:unnamed protein product [Rhizophagus irregularis]